MNIKIETLRGAVAIDEAVKIGREVFGPRFYVDGHRRDDVTAFFIGAKDLDVSSTEFVGGRLSFDREISRDNKLRMSQFVLAVAIKKGFQSKDVGGEIARTARRLMIQNGISYNEGLLYPQNTKGALFSINKFGYRIVGYKQSNHIAIIEYDKNWPSLPLSISFDGEIRIFSSPGVPKSKTDLDREFRELINNGLVGVRFNLDDGGTYFFVNKSSLVTV